MSISPPCSWQTTTPAWGQTLRRSSSAYIGTPQPTDTGGEREGMRWPVPFKPAQRGEAEKQTRHCQPTWGVGRCVQDGGGGAGSCCLLISSPLLPHQFSFLIHFLSPQQSRSPVCDSCSQGPLVCAQNNCQQLNRDWQLGLVWNQPPLMVRGLPPTPLNVASDWGCQEMFSQNKNKLPKPLSSSQVPGRTSTSSTSPTLTPSLGLSVTSRYPKEVMACRGRRPYRQQKASNAYLGGPGVLSRAPRGELGHPNSFLERVTKCLLNHDVCCTATRTAQHWFSLP